MILKRKVKDNSLVISIHKRPFERSDLTATLKERDRLEASCSEGGKYSFHIFQDVKANSDIGSRNRAAIEAKARFGGTLKTEP